jgi:hypothetical protein
METCATSLRRTAERPWCPVGPANLREAIRQVAEE